MLHLCETLVKPTLCKQIISPLPHKKNSAYAIAYYNSALLNYLKCSY